jgi:hypothetical protein
VSFNDASLIAGKISLHTQTYIDFLSFFVLFLDTKNSKCIVCSKMKETMYRWKITLITYFNKQIKDKKMKNLKNRVIAVSVILFLCAMNISAQVRIGKDTNPHAAAVLDLSEVPSQNLGLLMPRVPLANLTSFQLIATPSDDQKNTATGMLVFNTAENLFACPGLYVWDGSAWNRLKGEDCPIPPVTIDPTACPGLTIPSVRFMDYNLGADPTLNTPKKQMEYLATKPFDQLDAHVYGGLYQWGRKGLTHGASADYRRYNGSEHTASGPINTPPSTDEYFYLTGSNNWWTGGNDDFWGNGSPISNGGANGTLGGIFYQNSYYQNTYWEQEENNPCPAGFRVPTQDEWERLLQYNCNPTTANGWFEIKDENTTSSVLPNNLIWVAVECSSDKCVPGISWGSKATGFAIYPNTVWSSADEGYRNGTLSLYVPGAPEPLLFLPAAGQRDNNNGSIANVGGSGYYWSSTIENAGTSSYGMLFNHNNSTLTARANGSGYRAYGYSIRCVEK